MFAVVFEVRPRSGQRDAYLGYAKLLRPELVQVEGFIDNVRYASLRREGWILSLSTWRDEKSLVRWRTHALHHEVQQKGRFEVFEDYHLRVGEVVADTSPPAGQVVQPRRPDQTETGAAKLLSVTEAKRPDDIARDVSPEALAARLGLPDHAPDLIEWDVFEAVLTPGDLVLLAAWRDAANADPAGPQPGRQRRIRVIRDYGMHERREAPQYYPPVAR